MARKKRLSWDNWRNLWINVPENLLSNFTTAKYSPRGGCGCSRNKSFHWTHCKKFVCRRGICQMFYTSMIFTFYPRQTHKSQHFWQKYIYIEQIVSFCAIIYSNIAWIHTANLHRKGIFLRQFLKNLPKGKWIYFSAASDASDKLLCIKNDKVLKS